MSQLNIYVPDALAKELRLQARRQGKSLSAYFQDLIRLRRTGTQWPKGFFKKICGRWQGDFPEIEALPEETREEL